MRRAITCLTLGLGLLPAPRAGGEQTPSPRVACDAGHVDGVVALHYDQRILGNVTGLFIEVGYPASITLPGSGADKAVGTHVTSLLAEKDRLVAADEDANKDGREDRVRLLVTAGGKGIKAGDVARLRFDCAAGSAVAASEVTCRTDQISDDAARPMAVEQARDVTCTVTLAKPAPSGA